MGIAPAVIRTGTTVEEMQAIIDDHKAHDGTAAPRKVAPRKKSALAKTRGTRRAIPRKKSQAAAAEAPARPARKKTQAAATAGTRKSRTVSTRPRKTSTSKTASARKTRTSKASTNDVGRHLLNSVDYKLVHEGWNPRPGSPPDRIVKALAKFKGNRKKVYDFLLPNIDEFVKPKRQSTGAKLTKSEKQAMLVYRISRTAWEFATRTGQHEQSKNRPKYGTGGTGTGAFEARKVKTAPAASGAPRKTKTAPSASKRSQAGRKAATASRGARKTKTTAARKTTAAAKTKTAGRRRATAKR
jgi:hypothetical protein